MRMRMRASSGQPSTPAREGEEEKDETARLLVIAAAFLLGQFPFTPQLLTPKQQPPLTERSPTPAALPSGELTSCAQPLDVVGRSHSRTRSSRRRRRFSLTLVPGRYRVSIRYAFFARFEQDFTVAAGEKRTWDVRLAAREPVLECDRHRRCRTHYWRKRRPTSLM